MNIGKDYKIESDALNVTLFKRGTNKKKGIDTWPVLGYFADLKAALRHMAKHEVNAMGLNDLKAVAKKQDEIYKLIESLKRD